MKKVLLTEDDFQLAFMIKDQLEIEGFEVLCTSKGNEVLPLFKSQESDIILLDVNLEDELDGFTVGKQIRDISNVPIIFVTARNQLEDLKKGFQLGNIDYLKKPYAISELVLRIHELLSKNIIQQKEEEVFQIGQLHFVPSEHLLTIKNQRIHLTNRENIVLKLLFENKNQLVSRNIITLGVWDEHDSRLKDDSLNNIISSLRSKLAEESNISIITIQKEGYKLVVN